MRLLFLALVALVGVAAVAGADADPKKGAPHPKEEKGSQEMRHRPEQCWYEGHRCPWPRCLYTEVHECRFVPFCYWRSHRCGRDCRYCEVKPCFKENSDEWFHFDEDTGRRSRCTNKEHTFRVCHRCRPRHDFPVVGKADDLSSTFTGHHRLEDGLCYWKDIVCSDQRRCRHVERHVCRESGLHHSGSKHL